MDDTSFPVVVGVPTWCEAGRIHDHIRRIDGALYDAGFGAADAIIVNADNSSPDGTSSAFMATETGHEKLLVSTDRRGKGFNCAALFEFAMRVQARVLVTLDADLEVLPLDWLPALTTPILMESADLVTPLYPRHWYDANQTNQIAAPLFLAVTGVPVRQPIGGDFAFSTRALQALTTTRWPEAAFGFGWDGFVVTTALLRGLAIRQAPLSSGKIHSWRSDSVAEIEQEMDRKFWETTSTMIDRLVHVDVRGKEPLPRYPPAPPLGRAPKPYDIGPIMEFARRGWAQHRDSPWVQTILPHARPTDGALSDAQWARVLARTVRFNRNSRAPRDFYDVLQTVFFCRLCHVLPDYMDRSPGDIDDSVHRIASLTRRELLRVDIASQSRQ